MYVLHTHIYEISELPYLIFLPDFVTLSCKYKLFFIIYKIIQ